VVRLESRNSPTRTRTWNKPVNSRLLSGPNPNTDTTCGDTDPRRLRACTTSGAADPDLARVVNAWPDLPAHVRLAVMALVGTVAPNAGEPAP
jgi:hypothetical protein